MPRPRVAMRRIREVLRLKQQLGLSDKAVSRSVRIARSTVKEYRAAAAGVELGERGGTERGGARPWPVRHRRHAPCRSRATSLGGGREGGATAAWSTSRSYRSCSCGGKSSSNA